MPHSSGGGSHGGGSHHSSSHHSSSHRSGSGSSAPVRHVRTSYFAGSKRYVYMRGSTPHYIYADYDVTKRRSPLRYFILLFYLPFIFVLSVMARSAIIPPKKLYADYNTSIVVKDNINVISDMSGLKRSLQAFYDKTGISPAVFTVKNEDWQNNYSSLENYAYDLYVNAFPDEKHWLIVYSQPEHPNRSFNDWYWEGMQGDDTSDIITSEKADVFNAKLQRYLSEDSKSVSQAISLAFDETTPNIMKRSIDGGMIMMLLVFGGFICLHAYLMVFHDPNRKYRNAIECPEENQSDTVRQNVTETCPYCGNVYVRGSVSRCPNCQALLEIVDRK